MSIRHPVTGAKMDYPLEADGRGYIRPASLISVWATAPFLQNNTVGRFTGGPDDVVGLASGSNVSDPDSEAADGAVVFFVDVLVEGAFVAVDLGSIPFSKATCRQASSFREDSELSEESALNWAAARSSNCLTGALRCSDVTH